MSKKIIIFFASTLLMSGLFSGCSPKNNQIDEGEQEVLSETPQEAVVNEDAMEAVSEDLQEEPIAEKEDSEKEVSYLDDPYLACENNHIPFTSGEGIEAHGKFSFRGPIVAIEGPEPWGDPGSTVTFLRISVTEGTLKAVDYFKDMASGGNTINYNVSEELNFSIGLLKKGKISSTAIISPEAEARMLEVMNTGEEISLDLVLPYHPGRGAPANFTFACQIDLS